MMSQPTNQPTNQPNKQTNKKFRQVVFLTIFSLIAFKVYSKDLKVVYFSSDPPAIVPYRAFDPDSYAVINYIFDKLIAFDYEGNPRPWLAESWKRIDELTGV